MNIIGRKNIFLSFSGILVLAALACMLIFGFHQGIDFVGGTLWQIRFSARDDISEGELRAAFSDFGITDLVITRETDSGSLLVRMRTISEDDRSRLLVGLRDRFGEVEELRYETIGPSIGSELRRKAFTGVALVLVGISFYVAFAFRKVSHPVSSWKYGAVTLITLLHDVAIPAGIFAILGRLYGAEVDTNFVVAMLVVMGFSVHDTIVVFDRIRENLSRSRRDADFAFVVNASVNETLARSVNTSLTLIFVLLAVYLFGPAPLRYFTLALIIGTVAGTYSSIFVASPLLVVWHQISQRSRRFA